MTSYGEDLAHIHDVAFGDLARGAAPWLLGLLRGSGLGAGRVVDLGCGSGLWAAELAAAGYDVLGVDASPAMVALARRRAPAARFVVGSLHAVEIPPSVAVTCLGEGLNYRADDAPGDPWPELCRRVFSALVPGGFFVFDLVEAGSLGGAGPLRRSLEGPGWAVLVEATEEPAAGLLRRRIVTFREIRGADRRGEEVHDLRLFERRRVLAALRGAGFRVRVRRAYGAHPLLPGRAAFVAR